MADAKRSTRRFIFFYINRAEPDKIRQIVPAHVSYWKNIRLRGYMGGPFGDRTGGLISFVAASMEEAEQAVLGDPFVREDLIAEQWVKEWSVEETGLVEDRHRA